MDTPAPTVQQFLGMLEALEGFPVEIAWQEGENSGWNYPVTGVASRNTRPGEGPYRVTHFFHGPDDDPSGHWAITAAEFHAMSAGDVIWRRGWAARKARGFHEALRGFPVKLAWEQDSSSSGVWGYKVDPKFSASGIATPNTIPGEGPFRVTHFLYKDDVPSGHFNLSPEEFDQLSNGLDLKKAGWVVRRADLREQDQSELS